MNAIIYCRVSTKEQSEHGHSLKAQEKECRAFAAGMGYAVLEVFVEEGESAKTVSRTQLTLMMQFLRARKSQVDALIVWDIDRLSRNPRDYYDLDGELKNHGIQILTVKGTNDTSPIGKLVRSISVSLSEFENEQKRERVSAGMKQALEQGRWPWKPPIGYKRKQQERGTGPLIPDPKTAHFIREAFRLLENGSYSQLGVLRKLSDQGFRPSPQTMNKILHNPIYCGLLRSEFFTELLKGEHEPLVSQATFMKVQDIMNGTLAGGIRIGKHPDFPLRRFVICAKCGSPFTGAYSRGKGGRYAYYRCYNRSCSGNIPKKFMETRFLNFLEDTQPTEEIYQCFQSALLDRLNSVQKDLDTQQSSIQADMDDLKQQKATMTRKLAAGIICDDEYTNYIKSAQRRLLTLEAEAESLTTGVNGKKISENVYHIGEVIKNMKRLWENATMEHRIKLQTTVFPDGILYEGGNFLNPGNSPLFNQLSEIGRILRERPKKTILNPITSLQDKKIPALSKRVSSIVPPRGIEPLFPP